jgi:hypothetical protein
MSTRNPFVGAIAVSVFAVASMSAAARDLAGISFKEFARRSDLVVAGVLVKAEMLDGGKGGRSGTIRYTYRVTSTFKGDALSDVTFDAPAEENVNKEVGRMAIVALRKVGDGWALSVDERSCWRHANRMTKDFRGQAVYEVPATLLHDLPADLAERQELMVAYGDGWKPEMVRVFPTARVEERLRAALKD